MTKDGATPVGKRYIQIQKEMEDKYEKVMVLMEIGKFYEVYTFENEKTGKEIGRAKEMSRICNIMLTRKNKNQPLSLSNPHMCGFPSHSLPRFVSHLVEKGYTVVVSNQPQDGGERTIHSIYSPSVMIGLDNDDIVIQEEKDRSVMAIVCSTMTNQVLIIMVCVNTSSGKVFYEEECLQEAEARSYVAGLLDAHQPSEVLHRGVFPELFQTFSCHPIPEWVKEHKKFSEIEFQQTILQNVYKKEHPLLSIIEELGLERNPDVLPVLCFTLQFLYDHNPMTVFRIEKPCHISRSGIVYFQNQSLYDLNIFSNDQKSLFDILDQTLTPAGKRLLRKTMYSPIYDIEQLTRTHEEIERYIALPDPPCLKKKLSFYHTDLDHHFRRLQIGNISVLGMYRLLKTCMELKLLLTDLNGLNMTKEAADKIQAWEDAERCGTEMWDLNLMQSWKSWEQTGVWKTTPDELLEKENEWSLQEKEIREWIRQSFGTDMLARLCFTEEEVFLNTTKKMFREMKKPEGVRSKAMASCVRVYHDKLDEYNTKRRVFFHFLSQTRKKVFQRQASFFLETYESVLRFILDFVARLDLIQCHAQNARKYRLSRPTLCNEEEKTFIECKQVRHLVVEAANPNVKYVPNDVALSRILLFGQNSAGKCFEKGTPMVLWEGESCLVEELRIGDRLIGDDGTPREILFQTDGYGMLYDIVNEDDNQVLFTVNDQHILCLTDPDRSRIMEVSVKEILADPEKYKSFMFQCGGNKRPSTNKIKTSYFSKSNTKLYLDLLKKGHRFDFSDGELIRVLPEIEDIVPFTIRKKGMGHFFGFGLNGNERFLLPNGIMAHNSTLMKSIGVSVLMAQSGMFVPCQEMTFTPIRSLFTKIGSRDNIWKGKSTFISEMSELRHMLDRSDHHSLILCDEPTSGTESYSATGIIASSLYSFMEKNAMFVMTTHLHTLKEFNELMTDPRLQIKHLGMEYDSVKKKLCFDRILRDGFGKSIYGLEIAEYLGFSPAFLKKAYDFRSRLEKMEKTTIIPKKRSRYNSKKWVDTCESCHSKENLHTHHIEHQQDADKDGYIGSYHKNRLSNLKILCRDCHEKEHA